MLIEEAHQIFKSDNTEDDVENRNVSERCCIKMLKPDVITILDSEVEKTIPDGPPMSGDLIIKLAEMKEHSDDEWYPPTPPLYDVTDKLR